MENLVIIIKHWIVVNTIKWQLINNQNSIKTLESYNKYENISDYILKSIAIQVCTYYEKSI